jgi:hypothetical protein
VTSLTYETEIIQDDDDYDNDKKKKKVNSVFVGRVA